MKNCPFCGCQIEDGDHFCKNCGKEVNGTRNDQPVINEESQSPEVFQESSSKNKLLIVLFFIALIILGMGWWSWMSSQEDSINGDSNANTEVVNNSSKDATVTKEVIIKRLEEIFDNVVKGKAQDCDERYFSSDFKRIYKKVEDLDNRINQGEVGFWDSGFWDMSQDCNGMRIVVNDVYDVKDNEAIAKVTFTIKYDDTSKNYNEEIKVILEDGKWVLDDVHGYKKRMKDYYEDNKDSQPSTNQSDLDWLQGHWVYEQGNYKGHFVIEGNTLTQYSSMNPEHVTNYYRIDGDELYAGEMTAKLDLINHRIDYGDGYWMHKVSSASSQNYSNSANSSSSQERQRPFSDGEDVMARLYNQKFRHSSGLEIIVDGYGRIEIDGDPAGILSVLRYNSESALLRYGNGLYGEGKLLVKIEGNRLVLQDTADGSVFYQKR